MEEQVVSNVEVQEKVTPQYNLKPRTLARILSVLVDIFTVFLLGFLVFQIELATPISNDYYALREDMIVILDNTKIETEYGHKMYEDEEGFSEYKVSYHIYTENDETSEKKGMDYVVVNNADISTEVKNNYVNSLKNNGTYQSHYLTYRAIYFGLLMLAVGSVELVAFLVIPLTNKRRATIGKFVALTSLISSKETKVKWWQILIRFLFILLIETALPLFYLSEFAAVLVVVLVNLIVMFISRKTSRTLRDYVSFTRIIDMKSFKTINEQ